MEEESEEEEDNYNQAEEKPRDHFVTNPEEMRALAEQRRLSRRGSYRPGPAPSQRNVVGNRVNYFRRLKFFFIRICLLFRRTTRSRTGKRNYRGPTT